MISRTVVLNIYNCQNAQNIFPCFFTILFRLCLGRLQCGCGSGQIHGGNLYRKRYFLFNFNNVVQRMKKKEFKLQWPKPPLFNKNSGEEPKSRLNETRTAPYEQVVLGIMLENYSKFNLKNPTFHRDDYWCGYTRRINPIRQVDSGSGKLFVVDNDASKGAICGSVSWQLNDGYKDLNVRLVLTFDVPWK